MTTLATPDERIKYVNLDHDMLTVGLMDGRRISTPLAWYPGLAGASRLQLEDWEIIGAGDALHWARFDEDISVHAMLGGYAAPAPGQGPVPRPSAEAP